MTARCIGFLLLVSACRNWHEPLPFDECQPHPLECDACLFEADVESAPEPLLRVWTCEDETAGRLFAIRRRASNVPAFDTHFYDAASGLRVASVREHDTALPICGRDLVEEWWGEILDCVAVCELEPELADADPALAVCEPTA